jgi:hypothetical protein
MTPVRLLLLPITAATVLASAPPAAASCVSDSPPRSPHAFTGVVVRTHSAGRVALVRTDDGRTVTVLGGEPRAGVASSVDRTYDVGARYEFSPTNTRAPYQDNACTATRRIGTASSLPSRNTDAADERAGVHPALGVAGAAAVVLVGGAAWRRRRRFLAR